MTSTEPTPIHEAPETLRSILERGGSFDEVYERWGHTSQSDGAWSSIIDHLIFGGPGNDPRRRYDEAQAYGDLIRGVLDDGYVGPSGPDGLGGLRVLLAAVWGSEIASDDAVAYDLLRAMPTAVKVEYEWRRRMTAIPHRLMAGTFDTSDQYHCGSCGEQFEKGDRYVMAERLGHALFCVACVEDILTAAKAVSAWPT